MGGGGRAPGGAGGSRLSGGLSGGLGEGEGLRAPFLLCFGGVSVPPEPAGACPTAHPPPSVLPPCPSSQSGVPGPPHSVQGSAGTGLGGCVPPAGIPPPWRCPGGGCSHPRRFWGAFFGVGGVSALRDTPHLPAVARAGPLCAPRGWRAGPPGTEPLSELSASVSPEPRQLINQQLTPRGGTDAPAGGGSSPRPPRGCAVSPLLGTDVPAVSPPAGERVPSPPPPPAPRCQKLPILRTFGPKWGFFILPPPSAASSGLQGVREADFGDPWRSSQPGGGDIGDTATPVLPSVRGSLSPVPAPAAPPQASIPAGMTLSPLKLVSLSPGVPPRH